MTDPDTITINRAQFKAVAIEAFRDATQLAIARMTELAPPEHQALIVTLGARLMAELDEPAAG